MIDKTAAVRAALEMNAGGATVSYAYPQVWVKPPVISYFETDNSETERADDEEALSNIAYTVDIWARTPEETHALGAQMNRAMQGIGFTREGCNDLIEQYDAGVLHHRTMRFSIMEG